MPDREPYEASVEAPGSAWGGRKERAGAGRDSSRTRLPRPNPRARSGTGKKAQTQENVEMGYDIILTCKGEYDSSVTAIPLSLLLEISLASKEKNPHKEGYIAGILPPMTSFSAPLCGLSNKSLITEQQLIGRSLNFMLRLRSGLSGRPREPHPALHTKF